jgi:hypothetical protein
MATAEERELEPGLNLNGERRVFLCFEIRSIW